MERVGELTSGLAGGNASSAGVMRGKMVVDMSLA